MNKNITREQKVLEEHSTCSDKQVLSKKTWYLIEM